MWEIYGRDTNAIAVQTTVGRIRDGTDSSDLNGHSLLLQPVVYQRAEDVLGVLLYEDCFFRKRPHFAFEQEVRISLDTYSRINPTKDTPYGHRLRCSINTFIESIYIHPDSATWFLDVVNSITTRYQANADKAGRMWQHLVRTLVRGDTGSAVSPLKRNKKGSGIFSRCQSGALAISPAIERQFQDRIVA